MVRNQWRKIVLAAGLLALGGMPAVGQGVGTPYRSPYPALSPWLNLYQKKGGPVDNYHMFVQPQLQLRDTLQQQQTAIQRQGAGLNTLGNHLHQMEQDQAHPIAPTGVGGGFMNHAQYFGVQGRSGQGAVGGRRTWTPKAANTQGARGGGF